ncbi:MAG: serine acetyltransferase [Candidatus Binatia bacterium]|nr:MAG: serine acetyltransferase [Candidatus Binatia bacterium]
MRDLAERHAALEAAIDLVTESYTGEREIDSLESAALPNRRAVIEALNHLKPVLYIGFYSRRPLTRANLRFAISEHLYPAYDILTEQIHRAVSYEDAYKQRREPRDRSWSERIVLELFRSLPAIRDKLNKDVLAAYEGDPAAKSVEEVVFSYPAIEAITVYRIAHELYVRDVPMIPRIMSEYAHSETGIDIHPGARIGERFFIDHGTGCVIGETCVIGNNVKLYQGVTLGALSLPRTVESSEMRDRKRHPTIEDDVVIYSGATILGGDTVIGRGSVIGGNAWLTRSVPPGTRIVGESRTPGKTRS